MSEATATAAAELSPAEKFRKFMAERPPTQVVDVQAPSGFTYKFQKPAAIQTLFSVGHLPQTAASAAIEAWAKTGLLDEVDAGQELAKRATPEELRRMAEMSFSICDRVLMYSVEPKLVDHAPENDREVSVYEIPPDDLNYLFKWVAAGGEASAMLGTFPRGAEQRPVAGANRKARRASAKRAGGAG